MCEVINFPKPKVAPERAAFGTRTPRNAALATASALIIEALGELNAEGLGDWLEAIVAEIREKTP